MTFPMLLRRLAMTGATLSALASAIPASADSPTELPAGFRTEEIATNGTTLHVRVGGSGPAVVLLHGYGETGDMWAPLAERLVKAHTVIVPDLRGMGLSARADAGFDKVTQAQDIVGVMDALHARDADVVAHDIGNMVAFALASQHPARATKLVMMDAPVPGVGPWDEILKNPLLWHFRFGGPDMERLVAGRERIYLDRFWNEFSADPKHFPEASRVHYAQLYAAPGRMHAGFAQFAAFDRDATDNRAWLAAHGKLAMPVLAVGGAASFGPMMATVMRAAAIDVEEQVIAGSGHWLMEEQPAATIAAIEAFVDARPAAAANGHPAPATFTLEQIQALPQGGAGTGTSRVGSIRTVLLSGDPATPGPYVLEIHVPPHTFIAPHTHRDDRFATVISGTWFFGYGSTAADAAVKPLTAGGLYTEPGGAPHFAFTRDEAAVVRLTGNGPSDTSYLAPVSLH